jgi:glycine oxidase
MSEERTGRHDRAELLVVGAGVIGLACAWRAAQAGLRVTVLDAGARERASEVAAGMIAPVGEASWGEDALLAAGLSSARAWPDFAAELSSEAGLPVPYRRCGALHVALDRDEAAQLRRVHELHDELGLAARWLTAGECRHLEGGLATGVVGGLEVDGEAEVDPRALLEALRSAVAAAGVTVEEGGEVSAVRIEGGGATGARLADGRAIEAERVLLAAGARCAALAPAARLPIRPVAGEIVRLRAPQGGRPCERLVVTERVYVVPREGGEVVVGATVEDRGFDLRVTAGGVHELLREAYRALPEIAELELVEVAAGLRPATPDNAPVLGATAVDGLMVAGGHHRNGILLAPGTAEAIATILTGGEPAPEIAALSPARFERDREGAAA